MMNLEFSPRRFGLLVRNNVLTRGRTLGLAAGVVAGAYLLIYLLAARFGNAWGLAMPFVTAVLAISSVFVAARLFSDLHQPGEATAWVMLPASSIEKYLARVLPATVGLVLAELLLFFLVDLLARGICMLFGLHGGDGFNPLDRQVLSMAGGMLAMQPVFVLGSLFFKKSPILKTLLAILAFMMGLLLIFAGVAGLAFYNFDGHHFSMGQDFLNDVWLYGFFRTPLAAVLGGVFEYLVFPLFFLAVGFLRLHEHEVK